MLLPGVSHFSSDRGISSAEYSVLLSLLLLMAVPAISSTGFAIRNTASAVLEPNDEAAGSPIPKFGMFTNPANTTGDAPSSGMSGPGGDIRASGGGTESNVPGGIEKAREQPLESELFW